MKIKIETEISPQELLELFEGNVDALQKAIMASVVQQMPGMGGGENSAMAFWQAMAGKGQEMFEQYQQSLNPKK